MTQTISTSLCQAEGADGARRASGKREYGLRTWTALKAQFRTGFSKLYHFKNKFPGTLALATAVYPTAKIDVTEEGVILKPSPPPVSSRMIAAQ